MTSASSTSAGPRPGALPAAAVPLAAAAVPAEDVDAGTNGAYLSVDPRRRARRAPASLLHRALTVVVLPDVST